MIRNKTRNLIQLKQKYRQNRYSQPTKELQAQPWWYEQYYSNKQMLSQINNNSLDRNITALARQYQVNPSAFTLKQVQKLITDNCQMIQVIDRWTTQFRYSNNEPGLYKNQKTMIGHFQSTLAAQILSIFNSKQIINMTNNQLDHQSSFSRSRVMNQNTTYVNGSFNAGNSLNNSFQMQDRNRLFQQVNSKIQNLNIVLRRMNTMVMSQGDLVNRIDQNLIEGQSNMGKANQQLKLRADRQSGQGQFTCYGKINKAITGLYIINIIILLLFFLKHLIF